MCFSLYPTDDWDFAETTGAVKKNTTTLPIPLCVSCLQNKWAEPRTVTCLLLSSLHPQQYHQALGFAMYRGFSVCRIPRGSHPRHRTKQKPIRCVLTLDIGSSPTVLCSCLSVSSVNGNKNCDPTCCFNTLPLKLCGYFRAAVEATIAGASVVSARCPPLQPSCSTRRLSRGCSRNRSTGSGRLHLPNSTRSLQRDQQLFQLQAHT